MADVPLRVRVRAPAKINLTLHVTGQRPDGYHLLDSLVVFADVGDRLELSTGTPLSLTISGPEGGGLQGGGDNLVLRAAALMQGTPTGRFRLEKNLPVSSGIGGGSADAAAVVRALLASRGTGAVPADLADRLLALGADIPVCLSCRPSRMRGVGEDLSPVPGLPGLHAVLANPRVALSTPSVFKALEQRGNPEMPDHLPDFHTANDLIAWLKDQRNDLQEPAVSLAPVIQDALETLRASAGCLLARMSGSGATCFGLYENAARAKSAAAWLSDVRPDWWVTSTQLGDMQALCQPRIS
ncbi:4-(cytidine 5'-diphospho)-2-C-methyl-D-erythritol kinase [Sulfitobacter sp. PR48]|uniref:4-(cytidine 5'-diphospho)-2-C-methyl-D-erythritol kinase n=1 Tax=Sulfitobacter sp. PR48 TaxID=3028383 RepID=UPI00237B87EF|nr:4-(cytidine 5'-diphospho)-2-C-methyl-D-erythritol kinase [Sulfitobacter sp. PR48]MDD9720128.1 4-(cytidine 5'-diphospho)-2-C-methyl-D-erythritol kinase [Sulfitobacter sp. PR48]